MSHESMTSEHTVRAALMQESVPLNASGHEAVTAERRAEEAGAERARIQQSTAVEGRLPNEVVTTIYHFWLLLGALWGWDMVLLSPLSRFIGRSFLGITMASNPVATGALVVILPAIIVLYEAWCGASASHHARPGTETYRPVARALWLAAGLAMAVLTAAGVIAVHRAARLLEPEDGTVGTLKELLFLVAALVSFIAHAGLVLAGERGEMAKRWLSYRWRSRRAARNAKKAEKLWQRLHTSFHTRLQGLLARSVTFKARFPESAPLLPPLLDETVRDYIRRHFPDLDRAFPSSGRGAGAIAAAK